MSEPYALAHPMRGHHPTVLVPSAKSDHLTALCECGVRMTVQHRRSDKRRRALDWAYRDHLVTVVETRESGVSDHRKVDAP